MKKQLSVIIPTYNRAYVLKYTISLLLDQITKHQDDVELIVCDNASNDDTNHIMQELCVSNPFIRFLHYNDHVEVGDSIKRSALNANGHYLLLWSDDDIPSPYLIDTILLYLRNYSGLGCLCFNRIEGYSQDVLPVKKLYLTRKEFNSFEELYDDSASFIEKYFCDMSFMSQNVINTDCWHIGAQYDSNGYYGFEFMIPLLAGLKNKQCLYLDYPLCIERHPNISNHSYASKWPLYIYVGIPRILLFLEKIGIINDWKNCYSNYHYTHSTFVYIQQVYHSFAKKLLEYQSYKEEIVSYQTDPIRIHFTKIALSHNCLIRALSKIEFLFFNCTYWIITKASSIFNKLWRW